MNLPPPLTLEQAELFLEKQEQTALFLSIISLSPSEQKPLLQQLAYLSHTLKNPFPLPIINHPHTFSNITPFTSPLKETKEHIIIGNQAIKDGKVLTLLLAGGDGSRLGLNQPKGCFEISLIKRKSLFQLHCEKIFSLQKSLSCTLPLIILTSPSNHNATKSYFEDHNFFNLYSSQLFFITQPLLPLYNTNQEWFFKTSTEVSTGPNGNGGVFQALTPFLETFSNCDHLMITNVDNPLANLYDPALIGAHIHHQADVSLRCFKKDPTKEKVGALAYINHQLAIIDYTSSQDLSSFPYGNINVLCFSFPFIRTLCSKLTLPIHWVEKKGLCYNPKTQLSKEITTIKGEKFITDTIAFAKKAIALESEIEDHFAPLKNLKGIDDVASVQTALLHKDQKIFHALTGLDAHNHLFELSMDFHYPDEALLKKCNHLKELPKERYIFPDLL